MPRCNVRAVWTSGITYNTWYFLKTGLSSSGDNLVYSTFKGITWLLHQPSWELLPHWRLQALQISHNPPCPFKNQWLNIYQHATKCRLFHLLFINTHCALDPVLSGLYASVFRATPNRTMKLPVSLSLLSHSAWLPPLLQTSSPSVKSWSPPWLLTYCSSSSHGCVLKNANKPSIARKLITALRKLRQVDLCEFLDSLVHIMSNRISMVT